MNYVEVILNVGIFMFIKLMWKMENGFPKMVFPKRFSKNGFSETVFQKWFFRNPGTMAIPKIDISRVEILPFRQVFDFCRENS